MTTDARDLACRELVELVTDYLEGRLPEDDRARFDEHLAGCDGCGTYLAQLRQVVAVAGALEEEAIPPDARDALLRAFRGWKRPGGPP